jgi:polyisoprenyl-teichoic acid--peptidoglycan teichoic acid transferase
VTDVSPAIGQPGNDLRRRRWRRGFIALTVVSTLILITLGGARFYLNRTVSTLQRAGNDVVAALPSNAKVPKVKGRGHLTAKPKTGQPFTVLILGTDSRSGTGSEYGSTADQCGCSDTIILARVNPQTKKVSLLSVPRDTRVQVPGHTSPTKINSAFGRGPDVSVEVIQNSLNIPINHWIVLDLAGFKSIVDAIGGIKMDFPALVTDKNAGLYITKTGCQKVNGNTALAISRARELKYLDPKTGKYVFDNTYEYGRARRQQIMMKVIAAHTVKKSLSNPLTAKSVIDTFTSHDRLAIDNQVSSSELLNLVGDYAGFDAASMQSFTLPTFTKPIFVPGVGNQDFEILQPSKDVATIQAWYDATLATPKATTTPSTPSPTTAGSAVTSGPAAPTTAVAPTTTEAPTTTAVAPTTTAGATPTATAIASPNEPRSWDPRPCS